MRVHLDAIKDTGLHLEFEFDPSRDEGLMAVVGSGDAAFPAPIRVTLDLHRVSDTVEVRGRVATRLRLACGRCLEAFEQELDREVFCTYAPAPPEREHPTAGDLELSADDVGLVFFDGEAIDTAEAVREEIMAALPYRPLCREECRGLCPRCGADLNNEPCRCKEERVDPRLRVLAQLKAK